jgi:maleylpyruvate isomerase
VSRPDLEFDQVGAAWAQFDRALGRLSDEDARGPSRLPGWSRAHVVAHLWGNAEGFAGAIEGTAADEVGVMYPGGPEGRARDIEGRATLPLDLITDGARHAQARLLDAWADMPGDRWDHPIEMVTGLVPAAVTVRARWREIVVHHVDLDVGFGPADLPADYRTADAAWLTEFRPDW